MLLLLLACQTDTTDEPDLGLDPTVPAQQGESRLGQVREGGESALFGGITAEGQAGDWKLYNSQVQFIVQGPRRGHGWVDSGGHVIDAELVREGVLSRDTLEDHTLAIGMARLFHAQEMRVVSEGGPGETAVLCATGTDIAWDLMQGMFELDSPGVSELGLEIQTCYCLPPDSQTLEIRTTLHNPSKETRSFTPQELIVASAEDLLAWTPEQGLAGETKEPLALAYTGRQGEASWSVWALDSELEFGGLGALAADLGLQVGDHPLVELGPGESMQLERRLSLARDTLGIETERRAALGQPLVEVTGRVSDGSGVAGARVHFVSDEGVVAGHALSDDQGDFSGWLPPGNWTAWTVARRDRDLVPLPEGAGRYGAFASAEAQQEQLEQLAGLGSAPQLPWATGRAEPEGLAFELDDSGAELELELPPASGLLVSLVDQDGQPLPGVVDLRFESEPDSTVPAELREALGVPTGSRAAWAWTADGQLELPAVPGIYSLSAGHDWRHERASSSGVEVLEGSWTSVELVLERALPTDGWLSMDSHLHASPSFDGALPMEDRLITCAATGVDVVVPTDHDAMADYGPLAAALGLDERMSVVPGVEVTSMMRGHFNLFPVQPRPEEVNGGAEAWWLAPESTEELVDRMLESAGDEQVLLQANHPRSPGLFSLAEYDAESGQAARQDKWTESFDLFELVNGGVTELEAVREDWFSFLDQGLVRTPVGSSDSHYRYIPCGMARTDVLLDLEPHQVDAQALREALLAGHVVAASGTTLRVAARTAEGSGWPGDTLVGEQLELDIQVLAPSWIEPGTLRVWVNGEVAFEEQLLEAQGATWFDDLVGLDLEHDAWVVVEVEGSTSQGDTWRGAAPYAAANAVLVDIDGDGWQPPGI